MAGINWVTATPDTGGATWVTGTALKTIKQISAAANQRVKIAEWDVSFNGTSNTTAPTLVEILRQTSAGTGLGAATFQKMNNSDQETIQSTGLDSIAAAVNTSIGTGMPRITP